MAIQRALITTKDEFTPADYAQPTVFGYPGREFNPYVYYNGETLPTGLVPTNSGARPDSIQYGTDAPVYTSGVKGTAHLFNGRQNDFMRFTNWYLPPAMDTEKYMVAFFYTPTALSATFQGLVTTREPGQTDRGFHIAAAGSRLNFRGYGVDTIDIGTDPGYSAESAANGIPLWNMTVGTTYHIVAIIDPTKTNRLEVYVNGVLRLWSTKWIRPGFNERSITIGNFLTTTVNYPAFGAIDDVLFMVGNANTPTIAEMETYRNYVQNILAVGRYIDYDTEPGSIQLAKKPDGTYATGYNVGWVSDPIDIGDPPIDYYGRIQLNAVYDPAIHTITISTRSSDDGTTFDNWAALSSDGTMNSPKKRYYQIKVDLSTSSNTSTPIVKELEMLEYERPIEYELISEPLRVFADEDTGLRSMGILNKAYEIWIEEEVRAKDLLTFLLPMKDPKRQALGAEAVEYLIQLGDRRYILKENKDRKDSSGKKISEFKAEAKWYELNDPKIPDYELIEATAPEHVQKILTDALPGTSWILGANFSTKTQRRTIRGKWKSVLSLLREVESTFGIELKFYYDVTNDQDKIDLYDKIGKDNKIRFYYTKNIKEIERTIDTYGMVTRLYPYGAGELDIRTVNGGVDYIENLTWVNKFNLRNKIRPDTWTDDRYVIPENLMEDAGKILEQMSIPNINYAMSLLDLSSRSGHEPESIELGDTVYPIDEDLMITNLPSRIMRRKYNVREPHKTEVELDQPKKELADAQSRAFDDSVQTLTETDPISPSDVQEMTVFNHLLNSRADDGLNEWAVVGGAGITVYPNGGFSGENSFKFEANYDEYKSIYQDVYNLSHRNTYSISAMVYKEGNITAGANGFVGIRVKVRYKPDANGVVKEETKLLKIPDVTNM